MAQYHQSYQKTLNYYGMQVNRTERRVYTDFRQSYLDNPQLKVEYIYSIELTEPQMYDLLSNTETSLEEFELRKKHPELERLYSQYKMMCQMYK